jgi:hypothetical protein
MKKEKKDSEYYKKRNIILAEAEEALANKEKKDKSDCYQPFSNTTGRFRFDEDQSSIGNSPHRQSPNISPETSISTTQEEGRGLPIPGRGSLPPKSNACYGNSIATCSTHLTSINTSIQYSNDDQVTEGGDSCCSSFWRSLCSCCITFFHCSCTCSCCNSDSTEKKPITTSSVANSGNDNREDEVARSDVAVPTGVFSSGVFFQSSKA